MKTLYLFVAISSVNHFAYMGARLAVVLYAVHLHASPLVVGVIAGLFGVVSAFFSVPAGRFMDRVGPARPMLWFSVIMVAGCALGFAWRDLAALFIVSPLIGTFYSLFFVGHTQWLGRIVGPASRATSYSLAALGFSAATFFAPIVVGFAAEHAGHAAAFVVLAAAPLFTIAVLALRWIDPPLPQERPAPPRGEKRHGSVVQLVREAGLTPLYGACVISSATWSIIGLLIPLYGVEIGMSASDIGIVLGSYSLASVVIRVFMTRLSRRFSDWQLMILSFAASAASIAALPLFSGVAMLSAIAFLLGLGMGLAGPISQALLFEASPAGRVGELMGLRVTAMNTTSTVIPLVSGAVSGALGVAPVFWAMAVALLAGSWWVRGEWSAGRD